MMRTSCTKAILVVVVISLSCFALKTAGQVAYSFDYEGECEGISSDIVRARRGETVILTESSKNSTWASYFQLTRVAATLLDHVMGFDVRIVQPDSDTRDFKAIADGHADALLESWEASYQAQIDELVIFDRTLLDAGSNGFQGLQGIYVTGYANPLYEAKSLEFWKSYKNAEVLALLPQDRDLMNNSTCDLPWCSGTDPVTGYSWSNRYVPPQCLESLDSSGATDCATLIGYDQGYIQGELEMVVKNLNLNLTVVWLEDQTEDAILEYSLSNSPSIFYAWTPDAFFSSLNMTKVVLPIHNDTEWGMSNSTAYGPVASDWRTYTLKKFLRPGTPRDFNNFISVMRMNEVAIADLLTSDFDDVDERACDWVVRNQAIWEAWLPPLPCGADMFRNTSIADCISCPAGTGRAAFDDNELRCLPCDILGTCGGPEGTGSGLLYLGSDSESNATTIVLIIVFCTIGGLLILFSCYKLYLFKFSQIANAHVFISYKHDQREDAIEIKQILESNGIKTWIDEEISPGNDWRADVANAIDKSVAVVFLCTKDSAQSRYCREEIYYAAAKSIPIVTLIYDYSAFDSMEGAFRIILQRIQGIDFTDKTFKERNGNTLVRTIASARSKRIKDKSRLRNASDQESEGAYFAEPKDNVVDKHLIICYSPDNTAAALDLYDAIKGSGLRSSIMLTSASNEVDAEKFKDELMALGVDAEKVDEEKKAKDKTGNHKDKETGNHKDKEGARTHRNKSMANVSVSAKMDMDATAIQQAYALLFMESDKALAHPRCIDAVFAAYEMQKHIIRLSPEFISDEELTKYGSMAMMLSSTSKIIQTQDTNAILRALYMNIIKSSDTIMDDIEDAISGRDPANTSSRRDSNKRKEKRRTSIFKPGT